LVVGANIKAADVIALDDEDVWFLFLSMSKACAKYDAGDAGKGAAWGALGGAIFGGARRNKRHQQEADWQQQQMQQQQLQQEYNQGRQNFDSAVSLCMESRNYKVQY
jgi:hypothetical protein